MQEPEAGHITPTGKSGKSQMYVALLSACSGLLHKNSVGGARL